MSEKKRFKIEKEVGLYRLFDNGKLIPVLDGQPICDLLNELNDENMELKKQNENLFEKLKFISEQYGYSEKLREMMK